MENLLSEQAQKYCRHIANLFDIDCTTVDYGTAIQKGAITKGALPIAVRAPVMEHPEQVKFYRCGPDRICRICKEKSLSACRGESALIKGCEEAYRWDGMYIYPCECGLILIAAFLSDEEGELVGGVVAGPVCMGSADDCIQEIEDGEMKEAISEAPCFTPEKIQSMSEILSAITSCLSGISHGKSGKYFYKQENLLNAIYVEKMKSNSDHDYYTYPIALERKLRIAVRNRDKEGAQVLLNQILAYIYVSNNFELEAIKPRITELVIVISRAAVDAGADMNEISLLNMNLTKNIEAFHTLEDLSAWISNMMHRFIADTFDFKKVKHADAVYKTIEYINQNYSRRFTLDELASSIYISKTYLSSIFKKETGDSISDYTNRFRVEKSKLLLLEENLSIFEIATICGFEGQSYFTKIFREYTGSTPKRYRENRGKKEKKAF